MPPSHSVVQERDHRGEDNMPFIKRYLIPRLVQYVLVIFCGDHGRVLYSPSLPNDPLSGRLRNCKRAARAWIRVR